MHQRILCDKFGCTQISILKTGRYTRDTNPVQYTLRPMFCAPQQCSGAYCTLPSLLNSFGGGFIQDPRRLHSLISFGSRSMPLKILQLALPCRPQKELRYVQFPLLFSSNMVEIGPESGSKIFCISCSPYLLLNSIFCKVFAPVVKLGSEPGLNAEFRPRTFQDDVGCFRTKQSLSDARIRCGPRRNFAQGLLH